MGGGLSKHENSAAYQNALNKSVVSAVARLARDDRYPLVTRDVDETKPIMCGESGDQHRCDVEKESEPMTFDQKFDCDLAFIKLIEIYDDPQNTMKRTQFSPSFDERVHSHLCAQQIAGRMQSRYARNAFYKSFAAKRVQPLEEDWHGSIIFGRPESIVRIEMNK